MAYAVKYRLPFKNISTNEDCRFDILENDYIGGITTLKGEGRSPVVQSWDAANVLDPVQGCKCVVRYLNERLTGSNLVFYQEFSTFTSYSFYFAGTPFAGDIVITLQSLDSGGINIVTVPITAGQSLSSIVSAVVIAVNAVNPTVFTAVASSYLGQPGVTITLDTFLDVFILRTITAPSANGTIVPEFPISLFLTTDDTQFMGNLYVNDVLKFTGFMVIDDFSEPYLTPPTGNTLTFTDNLALLSNLTLTDLGYTPITGRLFIKDIIEEILALTNLDLPLYTYFNLFPEGVPDRVTYPAANPLSDVKINTNSYLKNDDDFEDCRTVLEKILKANCCTLRQQQGAWTIVRIPEYKRFSGNIPGSSSVNTPLTLTADWNQTGISTSVFIFIGGSALIVYFSASQELTVTNATDPAFNGSYNINSVTIVGADLRVNIFGVPGVSPTTITADFSTPLTIDVAPTISGISISKTGDLIPIERSQLKTFSRPTKTVTNTFNYRIPQLLANSKLQRLGDFIGSIIEGDNTVDAYELKDWTNQNNEAAYIRVVTNTLTGYEVDRYIYMPFRNNDFLGPNADCIVSNTIEVNQNDKFNLGLTFRATRVPDDNLAFKFGFTLQNLDGSIRKTLSLVLNSNPALVKYQWVDTALPFDDVAAGLGAFFPMNRSSVYPDWYTTTVQINGYPATIIPPIPFDGFLKISFYGFNTTGTPHEDCLIKDFDFNYQAFINESLQIIGQENKSTNNPVTSKSAVANEIFTDDSPKFNIAGGVFYDDLTLTSQWEKQSGEAYDYRLGEINAIDEILLTSNWRTQMEGSFLGICNPIDYATIYGIDGLFIPYKLEIDWRQNQSQATFMEVSKETDPSFNDILYNFRYLYKVAQR